MDDELTLQELSQRTGEPVDRLKAQGLSRQALAEVGMRSGSRMAPLMEPVILYFHRKGWKRALREDAAMHLQDDSALMQRPEVPGRLRMAIVFADLSSFTPLTEAMGDHTAAQVLERFSQLVRETMSRCEGRVVKQIGDAFMLVFPEPRSAVTCALEIERRVAAEPQFPALRSGVHWGPVLYREGDYVGANVNVAARLAAQAQRHQVLVTAAVRKEAGRVPDAEFVPLGKRRLKGLAEELELFEVVPKVERMGEQRLVDPVCGMELDAAEVAARLSLEGEQRAFCSQACLQRFVAAPERYGAKLGRA
jgi:adenylate cyclase